jgi:hypothetical protein
MFIEKANKQRLGFFNYKNKLFDTIGGRAEESSFPGGGTGPAAVNEGKSKLWMVVLYSLTAH